MVTADQHYALDIARQLADGGVPVFLLDPARRAGRWDPDGGTRGCGYHIPEKWQETTADPDVIDRWDGHGVGAVMGHVLDLVDVDPRNGGDPDTIRGYLPEVHGIAETPSGGWHAYVRPLGVRSKDALLPGIDIKAGVNGEGHGFGWIAPTVRRPKGGGDPQPYLWRKVPNLAKVAADTSDVSRLVALIQAGRNGTRNGGLVSVDPPPWDDLPDRVAAGQRHATVYRLACALRGRGGWRVDDALAYMRAVVLPRLDDAPGEDGHGYGADDLEATVRDAFTRHPDGPSDKPDQLPDVTDAQPDDTVRLVRGGSFILDRPDERPALWGTGSEVLAASGEPTYIAGPEGVGKTTLAIQLVRARMGLDDGLLGYPVQADDRRVLYLAMDRPLQIARAFSRLFGPADRRRLDDRLLFWRGPLPRLIEEAPDQLLTLARHVGAGTILVDSVKDLTPTIEKPESAGQVNRALQLVVAAGIEVVALHHPRKASAQNKEPQTLDDLYGGRWLAAGAGSVISLWGKPGDPIVRLTHLKTPQAEVGPLTVVHDHLAGTSTVEAGTSLLDLIGKTRGGLTATDAARLNYGTDKPRPADVEKLRRKLDDLHRRGLLIVEVVAPEGRGGRPLKRYQAAVPATVGSNHGATTRPSDGGEPRGTQNSPQPTTEQPQSNHANHAPEQPRTGGSLEEPPCVLPTDTTPGRVACPGCRTERDPGVACVTVGCPDAQGGAR